MPALHIYEYFESRDHVLHICANTAAATRADLIQENVTEKKIV